MRLPLLCPHPKVPPTSGGVTCSYFSLICAAVSVECASTSGSNGRDGSFVSWSVPPAPRNKANNFTIQEKIFFILGLLYIHLCSYRSPPKLNSQVCLQWCTEKYNHKYFMQAKLQISKLKSPSVLTIQQSLSVAAIFTQGTQIIFRKQSLRALKGTPTWRELTVCSRWRHCPSESLIRSQRLLGTGRFAGWSSPLLWFGIFNWFSPDQCLPNK